MFSILLPLSCSSFQDHYAESLLPILTVSQRYLNERMRGEESEINIHPSVIFDERTGVPLDVNLVCGPADPIEVGAHIDPVGHNLYTIPNDGSRFSIVPMTFEASRAKLKYVAGANDLITLYCNGSRGDFNEIDLV